MYGHTTSSTKLMGVSAYRGRYLKLYLGTFSWSKRNRESSFSGSRHWPNLRRPAVGQRVQRSTEAGDELQVQAASLHRAKPFLRHRLQRHRHHRYVPTHCATIRRQLLSCFLRPPSVCLSVKLYRITHSASCQLGDRPVRLSGTSGCGRNERLLPVHRSAGLLSAIWSSLFFYVFVYWSVHSWVFSWGEQLPRSSRPRSQVLCAHIF